MRKPSNGIIIYLFTLIVMWLFSATQLWSQFFKIILKIGITDMKIIVLIDALFVKDQINYARYAGTIVGGIIALSIIWGLYKLKNWARKLLLVLTSLGIMVYSINLPNLLLFYRNAITQKLWLGYYLFAILIFVGIGYSISIIVFFTRESIKIQFLKEGGSGKNSGGKTAKNSGTFPK